MPRIPDFTALGGAPTPQAPAGVASYRSSSGAEGASALALAQVGQGLEREGDQLWRLQKHEQDKADVVRAEDAFTQLREKALELMTADEVGFVHKKGSDVARNPQMFQQYSEQLKESAKLIGGALDNDEQRQKFGARAGVATYQFKHDLVNHITRERGAYAEQVFKGTLDHELQEATTRWQDANAIALSLERSSAAINREGDRVGAAAEAREATMRAHESKVHAAVIGQALAGGNYQHANAWFELHKDRIDATTAAAVEKAVKDGTQKQIFNGYQREFIDSGRDIEGLNLLERKVAADETLDETRKNALLGRIDTRRETIIRQAISANERTERALEREINRVNTMTLQGFEPTAEQIAPLINAASGTALEPQVSQMINVANETRRFRQMPPIAQEAYLTQLEAAVRKDPTKFDVGMVKRFKTIHESQKAQALDNPVGFAVRQGFVDPATPAAQPLDLSKPDQIGGLLAGRFELARSVARNYSVPLKPLQPEEVALLQNAVREMAPENKSGYFGALAKSAGTDVDGYRAMMNQVSPDDPVTAAGGMAAMRGLTTTQGRTTADLIFRGQAYLNPSKKEDGKPVKAVVVMPSGGEESKMLTQFNNMTGDAFEGKPGARNVFLQTARAIYAERVVGKGDFSGTLDSSIWKQSIDLAIGGKPLAYNGRTVLPPPGMDPGAFKDGVRERIDALSSSGRLPAGMTAAQARALPLENAGDGVYAIRSGDAVLRQATPDGRMGPPVLLDMNKPASMIIGPTRQISGRPEQGSAADRRLTVAAVTGQSPRSGAELHRENLRQLGAARARATTDQQRGILDAEIAAEQRMLLERDERAVMR